MISDAYVTVNCDNSHCGETEEVQLTALGSAGSYDMRNVESHLERNGWRVDGDNTICEGCVFVELAELEDEEPATPYDDVDGLDLTGRTIQSLQREAYLAGINSKLGGSEL